MHTVGNECHCATHPAMSFLMVGCCGLNMCACTARFECQVLALELSLSVCESNVTEHPVSISIVTGMLDTLIVHSYGFTMSLCCVLVLYKLNTLRPASV